MNKPTQTNCTSVFKDGDQQQIKSRFTQKWIEIINRSEKNSRVLKTIPHSPFRE